MPVKDRTVIFTPPNKGIATGRNGTIRVSGLRIWRSIDARLVTIEPVTSRGRIGNCRIVIPTADLPQTVEALIAMRATEGEPASCTSSRSATAGTPARQP
jgi:hypothetical protein